VSHSYPENELDYTNDLVILCGQGQSLPDEITLTPKVQNLAQIRVHQSGSVPKS
jgi:hypothetical protein